MMSARSFQLGIVLAPSLPHFVHRIRGPKDGTGVSSGQRSTLTSVWYPQALQVSRARARPSGACCRASSAGSARHPCPTSKLRTDREQNQVRRTIGSRNETNSLSGYDLGASSEGACDAIVTAVPDGCPLAPLQQPSSAAVTI